MKSNYSPSINIIRDAEKEMDYIVTENAERSAIRMMNEFKKGVHAFSIIGSFGTGKSSFLWAFQQSLKSDRFFDLGISEQYGNVETVNVVGDYQSLVSCFNEKFNIKEDYTSNQRLFDKLYSQYKALGENGLLLIFIDEFGKFLEHAANHNPEKEMYFIQQLAEFVNDSARNIMLVTTLHQGLETYGYKLSDSQRNEWRKVRGRLLEITFNEPVEQLLNLASKHFNSAYGIQKDNRYSKSLIEIQLANDIFSVDKTFFSDLKNTLYPLDVFSAYTLTLALQRYGQNERSLFSFIQSTENIDLEERVRSSSYFSIPDVYDYLLSNYYYQVTSKSNPDFSQWTAVKKSLQRTETTININANLAEKIIKTIGLLSVFSSRAAKIDDAFLCTYFSNDSNDLEIIQTLEALKKKQIIRYSTFDFSYKLFDGTDLDIEGELLKAENMVSEQIEIVPKLNRYFEFPIVTAKAVSYKKGTPRLFEYILSEQPCIETPVGEIDGFINLIFNPNLDLKQIKKLTQKQTEPVIYAYFNNSNKIASVLYEIEKTEQVLKTIKDEGDKVAISELQSIRKSNENLLNHYVKSALFDSNSVTWVYKGTILSIPNKKILNKQLSIICENVYSKTPILRNELFNKHKPSGVIAGARKTYFKALVDRFQEEDLAFDKEKFPPEKTIYSTLLKQNGIHVATKTGYTLTKPSEKSEVFGIWSVCEEYLSSAKNERKSITELINILTSAPYKLKQGVIDFWVPTFLFIRKGDYALYSQGVFKPYINEQELYLITRVPENYEVKSFELNDLKLSFFNRYRDWLRQEESTSLTVNTFIESIRPILLKYKGLTDYEKKTNSLSTEALKLREAIHFAQDPERVFFDEFPKALGFDTSDLLKAEENFDDYIYKFQETLEEIQCGYSNLLNRIELFINDEILGEKCEFPIYKNILLKRFSNLKEHQLLPKQKTFLQRVNSPLNDRDSWLASVGQLLAGKPLTSIDDKDENILKDNLAHIVKELDNISVLEKLNFDKDKEDVFKLDFTTKKNGLVPHLIRIPKGRLDRVQKNISIIQNELGSDKQIRIAILAKLLKDEFEND